MTYSSKYLLESWVRAIRDASDLLEPDDCKPAKPNESIPKWLRDQLRHLADEVSALADDLDAQVKGERR